MAEGGDESTTRWLISYSDFMMQLVCLFILLYSVSNIDVGKAQEIAKGRQIQLGIYDPKIQRPTTGPYNPPTTKFNIEEKLIQIGDPKLAKKIKWQNIDKGVRIFFEEVIFFEEGKADVLPEAREVLVGVRKLLQQFTNEVEIVGNSSSNREDSINGDHWLLSTLRARNAAAILMGDENNVTVHPSRVTVEGKAFYKPIRDESNSETQLEARRVNRRIEIIILGMKSE